MTISKIQDTRNCKTQKRERDRDDKNKLCGRAWRYNVFVSGVARGYLHFPRDFVRVKHSLDVVRECWNCSDTF